MRDAAEREHQPADDDLAEADGLQPQEEPARRADVLAELPADGGAAHGGDREGP